VAVNALVGMALGATIALGVVVMALGAAGVAPPGARLAGRLAERGDRWLARAALGVAAAVAAFAVTGWLVGALAAAGGAALAPTLLEAKARRATAIARSEAIAAWAEMLRDTMAAAAGLQEAVAATAKVAPPPIRGEVRALAARIEREPFVASLRVFAADLADPVGDLVVAALVLAAERQSGSLGEVLGAAAASARASATMRLRVEAGRARTYTSTRMIVGVTVTFAVGLVVFNRSYLEPFDSAVGQLVLAAVVALFGAGLWSLARLGAAAQPQRLLAAVAGER